MKPLDVTGDCQMPCLQRIADGDAGMPPQTLARRLKLVIRRGLSPQAERRLKLRSNDLTNWFFRSQVGLSVRLLGRLAAPQFT